MRKVNRGFRRVSTKTPRRKGPRKSAKIGELTGVHDSNGAEIRFGDLVVCRPNEMEPFPDDWILRLPVSEFYEKAGSNYTRGRVLQIGNELFICRDYSQWYGDNQYDYESYGKESHITWDDGCRMLLLIIPEDLK